MYYGIVRNNVYQISINEIKNLPDPNDALTMYLQLSVKVKDWVKRKNGFNF